MPPKVVVLVAGKDPLVSIGGHGSYVRAHGRAAIRAGFEPHVFSVARHTELLATGFGKLHRTGSPVWPERPWMAPAHGLPIARSVERFVLQSGLHSVLIHSFGLWGGIGVAASRRLRRQGIRSTAIVSAYGTYESEVQAFARGINSAHGMAARMRSRMLHLWTRHVIDGPERRGYVDSQLVLINYESIRQLLQAAYGIGSRCRRVPYTSEYAFLDEPPAGQEAPPESIATLQLRAAPLIVALSRHDGRKGVDVLLHSLAQLRARGIPFRACLVGGGPLLAADRRLATRLRLEDMVAIPGYVPDPYPYLQRADVFVLPSLQEGSGSLSLIEALQVGLPVVASSCDGLPEDVEDARSALLVPPGDITKLSQALERLLGDAALRQMLAREAHEVFLRKFSPTAFADALREVYAELGFPP